MRRDTIFYQLFVQSPTLLFDLIPNPPSNIAGYTFDSVEVKETSFRIDGIFLPPNNSATSTSAKSSSKKTTSFTNDSIAKSAFMPIATARNFMIGELW
jgi:hypothetical protein